MLPRGSAGDDGVGEDEEFAGARDQGHGMGFAARDEPAIECLERRVPAEGGRQCCGVERAAQPAAASGNMSFALPASALLDERCQAGKPVGQNS